MEALRRPPIMLFLPNAHEIAQMAQFHPIPPGYQIDQNKVLDVSIMIFPYSQPI
jgi:hypothetical protein